MKPKYIEERFPQWYIAPGNVVGVEGTVLIDDGTDMYAGVLDEDAGELVSRHNATIDMIEKLVEFCESEHPVEFQRIWYGDKDGKQT